jgi:hypothetical protein
LRRRAILSATFAAVLSALAPAASAEMVHYDPALCPTDAGGRIYLRFTTGLAFGFPADAIVAMRGFFHYPEPAVADPDAQEGCPGNPFHTNTVDVRLRLDLGPATPGGAPRTVARTVLLGGADARSRGSTADELRASGWEDSGFGLLRRKTVRKWAFDGPKSAAPLRLQNTALIFYHYYKRRGACVFEPDGWEFCHATADDAPHYNGGTYLARPDRHPTRSGFPLAVFCSRAPSFTGIRQCWLSYQPLPNLSFFVRFVDSDLPIEWIFDFDLAVVRWLEAARA